MKKTYLAMAIILVLVALSVYGCSTTTKYIPYTPPFTSTTLPPAPTLISIAVTPSYPSNLTVGYTQQLICTATYSDGSISDILRGAISSLRSCIADVFFLKIVFNDRRLLLAAS